MAQANNNNEFADRLRQILENKTKDELIDSMIDLMMLSIASCLFSNNENTCRVHQTLDHLGVNFNPLRMDKDVYERVIRPQIREQQKIDMTIHNQMNEILKDKNESV